MSRVRLSSIGAMPGLLIVLTMHGFGQHSFHVESEPGAACISGEIIFSGDTSDLKVDLRSLGASTMLPQSAPVTSIGEFNLGCVKAGAYMVRILSGRGFSVHEEVISAAGGNNLLTIRIPEKQHAARSGATVSVNELRRKVNGKAVRELRKARKMRERSQPEAAMIHVMKALERDPGFVDAHIEAGIIHAGKNDHEQAAAAFQKAAELDPDCVPAQNNLAIERLKLKQYSEAEQAARRALQLDHTRRTMEYALGASLGYQRRNPEEAVKYLRRAAAEYPRARLVAAKVLFESGQKREAAGELKLYLSSNVEAAERARIEAWLERLQ